MTYRVLSLFAGIGGFDLGLERTGGFKTVAFCEIDPFCQKVLAKHWPGVPCYDDVRTLTTERLAADGVAVDVICGGFPCQDISYAGKGAGLAGERSGLWSEFARLIGDLRPAFVIVENSAALLGRGLGVVLGDLASLRYDAEWHCIPAAHVGAPHERDRVWIIAHADEERLQERVHVGRVGEEEAGGEQPRRPADRVPAPPKPANANEGQFALGRQAGRMGRTIKSIPRHRAWPITSEPILERRADGIPHRLDRVGSLGNAVVPQIPELIGNAILASDRRAA